MFFLPTSNLESSIIHNLSHINNSSEYYGLIMDDLHKRHRQEHKDLQSKITQKKKSATKKTRKGVNDECAELERQLRERQQTELTELTGPSGPSEDEQARQSLDNLTEPQQESPDDVNDLTNGLSNYSATMTPQVTKKPNRQKARLARRAAEQEAVAAQAAKEAEDLPNLRVRERESMEKHYTSRGLKEQEIRSDGHCLYAAVGDQLLNADVGLQPIRRIDGLNLDDLILKPAYKATRQVAASYIAANASDFAPFLEQPLEDYVHTIRETGEWGGHLELMALARAYEVNINVLQANGQVDTIESNSQSDTKCLWLAYYKHSFGLGEHYNSLRQSPLSS
ncbi:OTU domain-containing protein [Physcia stellaris]|nr:OTU domain-containing protein [Physcia stellaris]